MQNFIEILKALSDPNRARIIMLLQHHELCVCKIIQIMQLAPSTVSKHISILKYARLLSSRKNGQWIYYRITDKTSKQAKNALSLIFDSLKNTAEIKNDRIKLLQILKENCK